MRCGSTESAVTSLKGWTLSGGRFASTAASAPRSARSSSAAPTSARMTRCCDWRGHCRTGRYRNGVPLSLRLAYLPSAVSPITRSVRQSLPSAELEGPAHRILLAEELLRQRAVHDRDGLGRLQASVRSKSRPCSSAIPSVSK
jgi:hypothetical protein